jgi:DNA polymerase I-like protein with 3'-5' exonuclease and polymerase domains
MAEITGLPRKEAKIIGLGIMYGKGGYSLCEELGLPTRQRVRNPKSGAIFDVDTEAGQIALLQGGRRFGAAGEEGQAILDRYDANAPFVRKLSQKCGDVAKRRGFIRTVLGRKCRFPKDENGNYDWTYRALNRLIQGSSADQMKRAMIDVDKEGYYLQLQVHDELDLSVSSEVEGLRIGEIIQNAVKATVPFKVDVEIGPSWGEIK